MSPLFQEKPSSLKKTGSRDALLKLGETVKEGFSESGKKIFGWFKEFFTKSKEKGLKASLLAPFIGFLSIMASFGKKEKKEEKVEAVTTETKDRLKKLAETCPALPPLPAEAKEDFPKELSGTRKGILKAVEVAVKHHITGDHCWDWVAKVYAMAGCGRHIIFNTVPQYASNKYKMVNGKKVYEKTPDCGTHHAYDKEYSMLEPGDHIFINNKNRIDTHGNHSVIFLGWIDRSKLTARIVGYGGHGKPPYPYTTDFNKKPITFIAKPVPGKKSSPLVS